MNETLARSTFGGDSWHTNALPPACTAPACWNAYTARPPGCKAVVCGPVPPPTLVPAQPLTATLSMRLWVVMASPHSLPLPA